MGSVLKRGVSAKNIMTNILNFDVDSAKTPGLLLTMRPDPPTTNSRTKSDQLRHIFNPRQKSRFHLADKANLSRELSVSGKTAIDVATANRDWKTVGMLANALEGMHVGRSGYNNRYR